MKLSVMTLGTFIRLVTSSLAFFLCFMELKLKLSIFINYGVLPQVLFIKFLIYILNCVHDFFKTQIFFMKICMPGLDFIYLFIYFFNYEQNILYETFFTLSVIYRV